MVMTELVGVIVSVDFTVVAAQAGVRSSETPEVIR